MVVGVCHGKAQKESTGDPGFDDGGQFEKATAGPDPSFQQRQPVCGY